MELLHNKRIIKNALDQNWKAYNKLSDQDKNPDYLGYAITKHPEQKKEILKECVDENYRNPDHINKIIKKQVTEHFRNLFKDYWNNLKRASNGDLTNKNIKEFYKSIKNEDRYELFNFLEL